MSKVSERKESGETERMCIACRTVAPAKSLLRFVRANDGEVLFDAKASAPGRGAYLCADAACLSVAAKRGHFARAFEAPVVFDAQALAIQVKATLMKRAEENLGLAFKVGQCVPGRTKALLQVPTGNCLAIVIAEDLTENSVREIGEMTVPVLPGPDKAKMGHALGRGETGVVALLKGRISEQVMCDLQRSRRV